MTELINEFIYNYDLFNKAIATGNKNQFEKIETMAIINRSLEILIKVIKEDAIYYLDDYMIYNILLFSKIYLKRNIMPEAFTKRKYALMRIKNNLDEIEKLNIKQENFKSIR